MHGTTVDIGILNAVNKLAQEVHNDRFCNGQKLQTVILCTEREARVHNITLRPRPDAEVLMKVCIFYTLQNRIMQRQ